MECPPLTFDQQWIEASRFAGKRFEGLLLDVSVGKPKELKIVLRNHSDRPILVQKWKGDSDYEILVRDTSGKPVPLSKKGKMFFQAGNLLDVRKLKPSESITAILPVAELFAFPTPGEYTTLASLPVLGDVDAVLTANSVQIHIEKPTEPKKAD